MVVPRLEDVDLLEVLMNAFCGKDSEILPSLG